MSTYDYKKVAADYDHLSQQHQWQAPELLFHYLSKYARRGTRLLDIGVGTGISSQRFHEKGVELYGLDNSSDMLSICEVKGIFKKLLLFDLLSEEIPYPDESFDFIVCSGVLPFFPSLDELFTKVSRVVKRSGFFAFTFIENSKNDKLYISEIRSEVNIYHHSKDYINSLANRWKFTSLFEQTFTTIKDLNTKETLDHSLMILRKE